MTKTCKKCGTAFSEDLSTCPVCKTAIITTEKEDANAHVTASYAFLKDKLELVSLKSRMLTSVLFFIFGFTGVGFFYLKKMKQAWLTLAFSSVSLPIFWFFLPDLAFMFTLGLFLVQTILAFSYWFNPDAKDGRGELLK
jgi:TM2 domain-containing membrane protein YozV